jgi:uncharacterized membrane protein
MINFIKDLIIWLFLFLPLILGIVFGAHGFEQWFLVVVGQAIYTAIITVIIGRGFSWLKF